MHYSPLLPVHITGGATGILFGAAALLYRKGSARHALAGKVFVAAMLTMASAATYLAVLKNQPGNIGAGIFTFYLILTAWLTARRREGATRKYDWAAVVIPVALGILTWMNGIRLLRSGASSENGVPVGMSLFMGTVMLLAAAGDVRVLLRGGIYDAQRVVRHLWRMCFGLFIATGSFFLGQQQVFPKWLRGSPALFVPALLPLALLIFWVLRVRFGKIYKGSGTRKAQVLLQKETAV